MIRFCLASVSRSALALLKRLLVLGASSTTARTSSRANRHEDASTITSEPAMSATGISRRLPLSPGATGFDIDEVNGRSIEPVAPVTAIGADIENGRVTPQKAASAVPRSASTSACREVRGERICDRPESYPATTPPQRRVRL